MQKFLRKSRKWSALLIGMVVMTLLTVLVIGFLEKAMRLGKNIGGIERSVQAYYAATANIEVTLQGAWEKLKKTPWEIEPKKVFVGKSGYTGHTFITNARVSTVQDEVQESHLVQGSIWQLWNTSLVYSSSKTPRGMTSPFSSSYNLISLDKSVQLVIPKWVDWNSVQLEVRIPPMVTKNDLQQKQPKKTSDRLSDGVILWTFGNSEKILHATEEGLIVKSDISDNGESSWRLTPIILGHKQGGFYESVGWGKQILSLSDFYTRPDALDENCDNFSCVLKLSMLRPVETEIWEIPFLEYKITFNRNIPHQYATIGAIGSVGDYSRTRTIQIPQITTNTALDFAVLQ